MYKLESESVLIQIWKSIASVKILDFPRLYLYFLYDEVLIEENTEHSPANTLAYK